MGNRKKRFRMDKLNPKAFVVTRVISSDFLHRQKSIGITRLLLFRQKSRLLANKAKQVFKAMLILLNQLSVFRLVSPPERFSLFIAKRHKFKKNLIL